MKRTYEELVKFDTLEERFNYLKLDGLVGVETFGSDRYMNQFFYRSPEWRQLRDKIITRYLGCELGLGDYPIKGKVIIHHMNPILPEDIYLRKEICLNENELICCSLDLHNALHYSDESVLSRYSFAERKPGDTILWRTS